MAVNRQNFWGERPISAPPAYQHEKTPVQIGFINVTAGQTNHAHI
jgi:hypothetical protein